MARIPSSYIKKMLRESFGVNITEEGAEEVAKILEDKAREISEYAVFNAKKESRLKVTREDILDYIIKGSDGNS
ncbi:MAG: NFYB/HAP3 family transcription factor subunit [Candidatus Marsarchaeota archaeon]|jgi:histone H3/H4|nr:NFYB/HAP3 family transcription factor subunit [Candidatus Marsarchaeota archaeon]